MNKYYMQSLFNRYNTPDSYTPSYGTAGFRCNAEYLESVMFRCGVLMALRAKKTKQNCGVMITASHNPECDNGVKLIDCNGEMIDDVWQTHATRIAQAKTFAEFWTYVEDINLEAEWSSTSNVLIGIDTRKSGKYLADICCIGVMACNVKAIYIGCVTTPEMHYTVKQSNHYPSFPCYHNHLLQSFSQLMKCGTVEQGAHRQLHVDCANGVGFGVLARLQPCLHAMGISLVLYNTGTGRLNYECGADYVEKQQRFPLNMDEVSEGAHCCSLDGDADRIVYFTKLNGKFVLMNGDKIACLLAKYISNIVKPSTLSIGIIQTAYSNGSSTSFISKGMPHMNIECTHTGVHYLHCAAKKYDIGIYFEANGHGTVLFNNKAQQTNDQLRLLSQLLSQEVGDAIGNMLVIEYVLTYFKFDMVDWHNLYQNFFTKQEKLHVRKDAFETEDFGRKLVEPIGLQHEVDTILRDYIYANPRAFIRPSGTEDLVRLYVESEIEICVDSIAARLRDAVMKYCTST